MLEFDEDSHSYKLSGAVVPSVTTIIQAILPCWKVDEYYLQRGQATHRACELLDQNRLDWSSVDPEIEPRVKAWEKFRRDFGGKIVANEQRLASEKMRFAGTLDRLILKGNDLIVADLKNSVSPQVYLQLAAYSLLWSENHNQRINSAVAVELSEDATYRCYWMSKAELRRAEQQWQAVLTVYGFAVTHKILNDK